jgi:phage-related protein
MQKLTYVPFGGELGDDSNVTLQLAPPYILGTLSGTGSVETNIMTATIPGIPGEYVEAIQTQGRMIPCTVYVQGSTQEEMYKFRLDLVRKLIPDTRSGTLYYSNDHITVWTPAIPKSSPIYIKRMKNYMQAEIKFFCPSPYWRGLNQIEKKIAYWGEEFSFELEFDDEGVQFGVTQGEDTIFNDSGLDVPLLITIDAPATPPITITNRATDQKIVLNRELKTGERLLIDTTPENVSVTLFHSDGSTEDAFHLLRANSEFFVLSPKENTIVCENWNENQPTTVTISYIPLYPGV